MKKLIIFVFVIILTVVISNKFVKKDLISLDFKEETTIVSGNSRVYSIDYFNLYNINVIKEVVIDNNLSDVTNIINLYTIKFNSVAQGVKSPIVLSSKLNSYYLEGNLLKLYFDKLEYIKLQDIDLISNTLYREVGVLKIQYYLNNILIFG